MRCEPFSAFCLAAPRSGEGKTTVAMAVMRALTVRGLIVQGFKCGPDYIDPTFHALATGRTSYNLDTWMMGREGVRRTFALHVGSPYVGSPHGGSPHVAVCEGAMGLFDGCPGSLACLPGSTADCALALDIPVVLVISAKGMGSSVAALVKGFADFQPGLRLVGVIADGVGSERHGELLRAALGGCPGLPPLLGALPRNPDWILPERQLGLVPSLECALSDQWLDELGEAAEKHVDLDRLLALTRVPQPGKDVVRRVAPPASVRRMAVAKDKAFCFYYQDNEAALEARGWELVPFSPLKDRALPPHIEAVYLGGGYPEECAAALSANVSMRESVRRWASRGGEVYAECGGYMYLCRDLITPDGQRFPLCGVIDGTAHMGTRMRSLGYREARMVAGLPFGLSEIFEAPDSQKLDLAFSRSCLVRGHEFHWSHITLHREYAPLYAVRKGSAPHAPFIPEGVTTDRVRAGYLHLYWGGIGESCSSAFPLARSAVLPPVVPPVVPVAGWVIVLNGPSSAGKTTLGRALQQAVGVPTLLLCVDSLLAGCVAPGQDDFEVVRDCVQETRLPLIEAFHGAVEGAARAGGRVIVDHVPGEDSHWRADLLARLELAGARVLYVQVTCSLDALHQRERQRRDREPDWPNARRQYEGIHTPVPGQCVVDTTVTPPEACARQVLDFFREMRP